jgi:nucleolar complex protein 2
LLEFGEVNSVTDENDDDSCNLEHVIDGEEDRVDQSSLTEASFRKILKTARKGSIVDIRRVILAFKIASLPQADLFVEDEDQLLGNNQSRGFAFSSSFSEEIVTSSMESLSDCFSLVLGLKSANNKMEDLTGSPRWNKIRNLILMFIKVYLKNLYSLSSSVRKHREIVLFYLHHLSDYIQYFFPFERSMKRLILLLINFWGDYEVGTDGDVSISEKAFLRLRELTIIMLQSNSSVVEQLFRSMYLKFVKCCKQYCEANAVKVGFLSNSMLEIYCLDRGCAFQQAFLYVRQLALHLRVAFLRKGEQTSKGVKSWQYVLSIKFWSQLIIRLPSQETGLGLLIYPLVQLIFGVLSHFSSVYYLPLKFQFISFLQQLTRSCKCFIPLNHVFSDILDHIKAFSLHASKERKNELDLSYQLVLPADTLQTKFVQDFVVNETLYYLRNEIDLYKYSPSFPEYFYFILKKLKFLGKTSNTQYNRGLFKGVVSHIQVSFQSVVRQRDSALLDTKLLADFESFKSSKIEIATYQMQMTDGIPDLTPIEPLKKRDREVVESEEDSEEEERETEERVPPKKQKISELSSDIINSIRLK